MSWWRLVGRLGEHDDDDEEEEEERDLPNEKIESGVVQFGITE